jgi:hypothetical protein
VAAFLPAEQDTVGAYVAGRELDQPPYWDVERARLGRSRDLQVELVVNGEVAARQTLTADGTWRDVEFAVTLPRSSWVALRVQHSAHTNPVFVLIGGQPIRASRRSAEWCRTSVDRCWQTKSPHIRAGEKAAAKAAYDVARRLYDRRIGECFDDR